MSQNVERLIHFVEKTVREGTRMTVGQPNTEETRRALSKKLEALIRLGDTEVLERQFEITYDGSTPDTMRFIVRPLTPRAARLLADLQSEFPESFVEQKESEMFKHANTFFPGDPVFGSVAGSKTASTRSGTVKRASEDDGTLRLEVQWDDGTTTWEDPNTLQKKS